MAVLLVVVIIIMQLDHLVTPSGFTHPEASSMTFPGPFCLLVQHARKERNVHHVKIFLARVLVISKFTLPDDGRLKEVETCYSKLYRKTPPSVV